MRHKTSQALYAYWNEVRAGRLAPRRFDIEPARIGALLPDTFILERDAGGGFRFRVAGTRLGEITGLELRGSQLLDLIAASDRPTVRHLLEQACDQAPVLALTLEARPSEGRAARLEMLLLPLQHTEPTITRFLGVLVALDAPEWLGEEGVGEHVLVGHEVIWPEGRPHQILRHMHRQSPFAPESRLARIVSSERRRFRVYDGGRDKSGKPPV